MIRTLTEVREVHGSGGREYAARLSGPCGRWVFILGLDYPPDLWPPRDGDRVVLARRNGIYFAEWPVCFVERPDRKGRPQ